MAEKNATHKRSLRPELIIIFKKKCDITYADILRKVKSNPKLMILGENVSRIRHSQKENLILELKKSPGKTVENFLGKVEIVIQCKDFDEITTKEDIRDAFEKHLVGKIRQSED